MHKGTVQRCTCVLSNLWQGCCLTLEKGILHVWQRSCPTFDKGLAQRLTKVLPNVWQKSCPTFDKSLVQRLTKVLSNVWKGTEKYQATQHQAGTIYFCRDAMAYQQMKDGWSNGGRKYRNKIFDHQLNRISYNVLSYVGGRSSIFCHVACACIRVCVRTHTLLYMDFIASIILWTYNLWIKNIMNNFTSGNAYV